MVDYGHYQIADDILANAETPYFGPIDTPRGQLGYDLGAAGPIVLPGGGISSVGRAARGLPEALTIGSKQFGKKFGQHARELGLDPASARARYAFQSRLQRVFGNADEVRRGPWRGQGPGGVEGEVLFFRRGHDVVVTTPGGAFVTFLQGGASNSRFLGASVVP